MQIKQVDNGEKGRFYFEDEGQEIASMHYVYVNEHKFIIDHTEVSGDYEGQGLGKKLLKEVVAFARKKSIKIIPLCPFAKAMFQKIPEYADVLA